MALIQGSNFVLFCYVVELYNQFFPENILIIFATNYFWDITKMLSDVYIV